ncbi:MAG: sigma 54-interacting transcriptional regulator [Thermodesulfobacteriota bacterium]
MLDKIDSRFWKSIIDTIQDGLMLVDPDGRIMFVNHEFERMLGYKSSELEGKTCEVFKCDRCYKARANGFDKFCSLFKQKQNRASKCVFLKKNGQALQVMKKASVIKDEKGQVIAGVETLADLSKVVAGQKVIDNLKQKINFQNGFKEIIGKSAAMRAVFDLATSAAHSETPLIIYGESGTGKELLAAAVHEISDRAEGPFIKVNCAALNDNLLESELFGHVKGAFTGADYSRVGRFEAAHGGSILLDEIGDLPLTTQTKLLRVLQEKEIERVGDHRPIEIDVRIIAATHKNLPQLIEDGLFREDLFYRIGVIPITLPSLKERPEDIPLLVENFIDKIKRRTGKNINGVSLEAMTILMAQEWRGNVRELINVLEYAFVLCPGTTISPEHLPDYTRDHPSSIQPTTVVKNDRRHINDARHRQLVDALIFSGGNQSMAARRLGVSRVTIWKWVKKYGVEIESQDFQINTLINEEPQ